MKFIKTDQPETFLNISAIATVEFLKQTRTESLHARRLPEIPMESSEEEITGAEVTMINGTKAKIQAEIARKLRQIIDAV